MPKQDKREDDRSGFRAALDEIIKERNYQMLRWTPEYDDGHTNEEWLSILTVYMGKAAQECKAYHGEDMDAFRKRIRQVGAICAAVLESTAKDRK